MITPSKARFLGLPFLEKKNVEFLLIRIVVTKKRKYLGYII
jgi:hypothetical protein